MMKQGELLHVVIGSIALLSMHNTTKMRANRDTAYTATFSIRTLHSAALNVGT